MKNMSMSVWVEARELKFCMNMLCLFKYEIAYSDLEFFGIHLRVFLKNPRIFFKNGQYMSKSVWVEARELKFYTNMLCLFKYEIAYSDLEFFGIRLVFLKNPRIFFKNGQYMSKSVWIEA
jgi:hypothetical protein